MVDELMIVDEMISVIKSGKFDPDDKLPSENELAEKYMVPRIMIRKAYERLQEQGFIYSRQGKGSFVKDRKNQIPLVLSGDESFSKKMQEQGYHLETKTIFCEEIDYNKKIFRFLGVEDTNKVFKIGRLRLVDRKPIALHISFVAQVVFQDIEAAGPKITSMFDYYNKQGFLNFFSAPSTLSVAFPTKFEREVLDCASLVPLLVLESGCLDKESGTVLEYTKIIYRSDRFTYVI
ncbi:GntR family transcriptional regulator [Neobacillus massiliamazoniensis]|uniref:GntR family transcriptional regulator n=1 Tax=Neobacillus massiliamazoniensis TaxID=1499688 RepID=A0A0U1NVY9_9BACI|nr:GntR family transcriptional regulator [Neobacillus massiliamazoniensis]CRK82207.1 GntR family transcriptional regulator [Neobacillus massiliamazoniensis]